MKKLYLLGIFALCVLLSGCSEKKLLCSYSSTNSYYGSDDILAKYTFKKDGTIDKYSINEKMVYNDAYLKASNTTIEAQYENALEYCKSSVPESKNITCKATKTKNSITVVIDYKLSKMTKEEIESLQLSDYISSKYDDIKQQYEGQGFTCK